MTYQQVLDYLFEQLPMFQRIGPAAYKGSLDNTLSLSNHLGNPERNFPSIHIAGTNGKGSVSHMIASVLQEAGYKTGLATSPHLKDYRERIKINGGCIEKEYVTDFVNNHRSFFEPLQASFFEIGIALTFAYFSDNLVDIAVVETGMGGRLDSTNILLPEVSVITNIGLDHTRFLGDTLEKIAAEKAGIVKDNTPLVIGRRQESVYHVFLEKCKEKNAPLIVANDLYEFAKQQPEKQFDGRITYNVSCFDGTESAYVSDLTGNYQRENLLTALATLHVLSRNKEFYIPYDAIYKGLSNVVENTGLAGRWHQIGKRPAIICDTAHNGDGIQWVVKQIMQQDFDNLRMVIGMVDDKDISEILSLLPAKASYYFCKPNIPRGLDVNKLLHAANSIGIKGRGFATVSEALDCATKDSGPNDLIFVGGSTFVVAEVI